MVDEDPFGFADDHSERTRRVPSPGGRLERTQVAPGAVGRAPDSGLRSRIGAMSGVNALVGAATPLLVLLTRLSSTPSHPDPETLRQRVATEIEAFRERATAKGIPGDDVFVAQYVLCTALDEAALNTPWGGGSSWHQRNLLVQFHGEAEGGDKFFTLLDRMSRDPARNLPLLELMYTILCLGFQGRYRVHPDGRNRLTDSREQLFQTVQMLRDRSDRALSPHWHAVSQRVNRFVRHVPLWVVGAVGVALLLALYWIFSVSLNQRSDPVSTQLSRIEGKDVITRVPPTPPLRPEPVARPTVTPAPPPEPPLVETLQALLREDIELGQVEIDQTPSHAIIRMRGDGLFASGRAKVQPAFMDTIDRIAVALDGIPGPLLVAGHTDSDPIRTIRFPSNWHLSQARADAVVTLLAARLQTPDRLSGEGRAHNDPLVEDDKPANKARNRRVEILLPKRKRHARGASR